jgi:starch phosphorylase
VLGIGGVEVLRALGHDEIESYHMNEGHSALLALGLLEHRLGTQNLGAASEHDIEAIRSQCIFTTHTPVPAGHDRFPRELMRQVLGEQRTRVLEVTHCCPESTLNMTYFALRFSRYINGVAMHHGDVSQDMYPRYPVRAITNGVHAVTWTSPPFRELFDRYVPEWRRDNLYLRYARKIPLRDIHEAHAIAKRTLLDEIKKSTGVQLSDTALTIGFARRVAAYKRTDLLLSDQGRLRWIAKSVGPIQIVYGGKAHPRDEAGKALIRRVIEDAERLKDVVQVIYIEDYDIRWAQHLCSGVDLWVNTPQRPQEASGTSGMKAALNGVPSLSVLDGWWVEGHDEGRTGWAIDHDGESPSDPTLDAASLYDKLELLILPMFYGRPLAFTEVMRSSIALNGSFFNTQRMVSQYVSNAYFPEAEAVGVARAAARTQA